jgi:hypothetical protein
LKGWENRYLLSFTLKPAPHGTSRWRAAYIRFSFSRYYISRDPYEGWIISVFLFRVMIHDRDTLALYMSPGHHGNIHRQKYFDRGKPFPVAISFGPDPLLWFFGQMEIPAGSRSTIMPAVCAARHTKSSAASTPACRFQLIPRWQLKARSFREPAFLKVRSASSPATMPADCAPNHAQSQAAHVSQRSDHYRCAAV